MPFVMEPGAVSVHFADTSYVLTEFPIPAGIFTVSPFLFASIRSNTSALNLTVVSATSPTTGRVGVARTNGSAWTGTIDVAWWAFQQTPTSAAG